MLWNPLMRSPLEALQYLPHLRSACNYGAGNRRNLSHHHHPRRRSAPERPMQQRRQHRSGERHEQHGGTAVQGGARLNFPAL